MSNREDMEQAKIVERLISSFSDPEKTYEKVGDLLKGIPIEDLFIAISVWSRNCEIIYRLNQSQFPKRDDKLYQVPDLLAIYRVNGKKVPVLIEVKSIGKKPYELKISQKDYIRRIKYAKVWKLGFSGCKKIQKEGESLPPHLC